MQSFIQRNGLCDPITWSQDGIGMDVVRKYLNGVV
jgi:hypothetical protein